MLPTRTVGLLTLMVTSRSAERGAMTQTVDWSFAGLVSSGVTAVICAWLQTLSLVSAVAMIFSVALAETASAPTVHVPVAGT